jgi:p-hydroxybenzoate 3-monooxygenase
MRSLAVVRTAVDRSLCDQAKAIYSRPMSERTQVAIIGAGPAGLLLGQLLHRQGIEAVVIEARSRSYVEARIRAGVLEQGTMDVLREAGVGERMDREGLRHGGIYLCFDHALHHIPMSELTNGRAVMIYGQTEVVKDLIAARLAVGAPLWFECDDVSIDGLEQDEPVVRYTRQGSEIVLRCDFVAGCDGFHGICRSAIPQDVLSVWGREYPYAWLGILADVAPSTDELIYAYSDRGFALHSMRSPTLSRLYVQVDPDDDIANWPDERIWAELHARLASDGWDLNEGAVLEKGITPMRSFVAAPMRYRSLLLAGDAAHIVPPTGAKGLNLAVADVTVLAHALTDHLQQGSDTALEEYSDRCLGRVWRAQHFSWWMTTMLHSDPHDDAYGAKLQRSQLEYVTRSTAAATSLAENYVGLSLERTAPVTSSIANG